MDYPIEFTVPMTLEAVQSVLESVIESSGFVIEPDRWKKDTSRNKNYTLLLTKAEENKDIRLGMVELTQIKEDQVLVRLSERYSNGESTPTETGTPLMRFFILLTQQMLKEGVVIFDSE
jgi:hypothetical protein